MPAREMLGGVIKVLGTAKVTIATATTSSLDFGTPDDINLAGLTGPGSTYSPGDRIVAIFDSSTSGTTDTTGFVVQDAPDSAGSIGATATAVTDGTSLAGGTGDQYAVVGVRVQAGRPWLRFRATRASGTTDSTVVQCTVLAIPPVL